jgi:hypothetical protein
MGLFKSKEEKRIERDIEVRKGINSIKRNVKELKRHENSYLEKAKRAKQIDDEQQLQFLKRALRKCILTRKMRERQLLSIETAMQIRNQAEADANFATAMGSVSKNISELYGNTDMVQIQKDFEKALYQAESVQQRMEMFLDMTSEDMFSEVEMIDDSEGISEADIDKLLADETLRAEGGELDNEIAEGLKEIEDELEQ